MSFVEAVEAAEVVELAGLRRAVGSVSVEAPEVVVGQFAEAAVVAAEAFEAEVDLQLVVASSEEEVAEAAAVRELVFELADWPEEAAVEAGLSLTPSYYCLVEGWPRPTS